MEWFSRDCSCCEHLQQAGEWAPERCQPVCARARFPKRTYAEWDLMTRVVKKGTFGVITPMGGSVQTEYRVKESAFKFWAGSIAKIPKRRWPGLIDMVEAMHSEVEKDGHGKFPFTDDEFEELRALGERLDGEDEAVGADGGEDSNSD